MRCGDARAIIEELRADTRLWLPAISDRRGFSSTRIEHLLNRLVRVLPRGEAYLEVGSHEGRTLAAAAYSNPDAHIIACDPGWKYGATPKDLPANVSFCPQPWEEILGGSREELPLPPFGAVFYDADHSRASTRLFLEAVRHTLASQAVVILDDWDRTSVREAAMLALGEDRRWSLLAEMPEYTDGLTCPPNHHGYYFGVAVLGWRAS